MPIILLLIGVASSEWFAVGWPAELAMPGAPPVHAHDGFMLMFWLGATLIAGYLSMTIVFALSAVLPPLRRLAAEFYLRRRLGQMLAGGIIALAVGSLPILVGIEETAAVYFEFVDAREIARHASLAAAAAHGFGIFVARRKAKLDVEGLADR